jgi:mono/diheme cytochrome c family protein
MSKRTFIVFGLLVVVLAVAIPWLVFDGKGDAKNGAQAVPVKLEQGQELFKINCGNCHTLYAAGTDGNYGPDLDELLSTSG